MSRPNHIEREHYQKLVGRRIVAIDWDELEGQSLPVLALSGRDRDGHTATITVLADPEGNAPGHLDHLLRSSGKTGKGIQFD
jgi:hypothetical protein